MVEISERGFHLIRTFRAAFHALAEHKSEAERQQISEIIASHLRSSAPMALGSTLEVATNVVVPLGQGARVDFTIDEGTLVLYVVEPSGKDAAVSVTAAQAEQMRVALMRVMAGAR